MTAPSIKEALERSIVVIDDWLNVYASELCNQDRVDEANHRISNAGGTLAYIANVQQQNRAALSTLQPSGERREAMVTRVQDILGNKLTIDALDLEIDGVGPASYAIVDLFLASGLVQDEAGWRDISSAPRDGTVIFVRRDNGCSTDYMVVWWNDTQNDGYPWQSDNNAYVEDRWDEWMLPPIRSASNGGAS